jgi:hypothetical protein
MVTFLVVRGLTAPQSARGSTVGAAAVQPASCTDRLLEDWRDGRIDGTYPLACYRNAIKKLPVDLAVYSSAPEDIRQAMSERIVQSAPQSRQPAGSADDGTRSTG